MVIIIPFSITRQEREGTDFECPDLYEIKNSPDYPNGFYCRKSDKCVIRWLCEDLQCKRKGKGGTKIE